jgi:peptide/nickel transport system substrate-binding protein
MTDRSTTETPWPGAISAMARVAIMIALIAAIFAYTVGRGRRAAPITPPGYLRIDLESPPLSLDPRFAADPISLRIDELAFDGLVRIDAHGRFVGNLAQSFERPSPVTLKFHLRRGLHFSDERPLTARDVKYTYDSLLDPASASPKRAALAELASIAAPDGLTVVMTTKHPYASALDMATLGIVPMGTPPPGKDANRWPAASGAFQVASFTRGEAVVLTRNPDRPSDPGTIPGIAFEVVPNPTVRALELAEGECDLAENNIQPDLLGYLGMRPELTISQSPGIGYHYLLFNFRNSALRNQLVRQAIAYAISREAIIGSLYKGSARTATGILTPENWAYSGDVQRYTDDPFKASRLLDEAGYAIGPTGERDLKFVYRTTRERRRLADALKGMLARIGITLDVRSSETEDFYREVDKGNFDLVSLGSFSADPAHEYFTSFASKMTPPAGANFGDYVNAAMDRLLENSELALDPGMRREILAQVQKLAAADLPSFPLWWMNTVVVMSRGVKGFTPFPDGSLRSLAGVSLAPEGQQPQK